MKKFLRNMLRFLKATFSLVRSVTIIGMLVVGAMSVYLIYTAYQVTVNQYNESLTWEKTAYDAPLAEVEPVLVSNVIDTDIVTAADSWNALEKYVKNLNGENMDKDKAGKIMEQAKHWQEIYNLNSEDIDRLSLYLEIEDAIPEAYSTLKTDRLAKLAQTLHSMESEKPTKAGKQYMKRITDVVKDFMKAKSTVTDTILSIGTLKDGVWTIPYTYKRSDLSDVLEQIQAMRKFPALGNTADVLSDIANALNYNKNARDYFAYQKFMEAKKNITRSDYIPVSSIYTYGQALDNGLTVKVKEKPGYTIRIDSLVTGVYYNGVKLEDTVYIRKDADIIVHVEPIYEPDPVEPEPTPEPDDEQDNQPAVIEPDTSEEPENPQPPSEEVLPEVTDVPETDQNQESEGEENEQRE